MRHDSFLRAKRKRQLGLRHAAASVAMLCSALLGTLATAEPSPSSSYEAELAILSHSTVELFDDVEMRQATGEQALGELLLQAPKTTVAANEMLDRAFPAEEGSVARLFGYRATMYPTEKLLGAIDFMGTYDRNRGLVCGYVMWDLTDRAKPELLNIHTAYVNLTDLADLGWEERHSALLEANCAHGEIEANLFAFDAEYAGLEPVESGSAVQIMSVADTD